MDSCDRHKKDIRRPRPWTRVSQPLTRGSGGCISGSPEEGGF
jgi:hypothetical protein